MVHGDLGLRLSDETVLLTAGDAFTFPGREPHTWSNATTEVIWVLAPAPGTRLR